MNRADQAWTGRLTSPELRRFRPAHALQVADLAASGEFVEAALKESIGGLPEERSERNAK